MDKPQVYTPGAGHAPVSAGLPGRTALRSEWLDSLRQLDLAGRRLIVDPVITGLRGTGKTVLLERLRLDSRAKGFETVAIQATQSQGIWAELTAQLEHVSDRRPEPFWIKAIEQLRRITGLQALGFGVDVAPLDSPERAPLGRSGYRLAQTLCDLSLAIRDHQRDRGGLVFTVDEMQSSPPEDIELLGAALHQLNLQEFRHARVAFVGAALPSFSSAVVGPNPDAPLITHLERLFAIHSLPPTLSYRDAALALLEPAATQGGSWNEAAIDAVIAVSDGYPAHLQQVAATTWASTAAVDINESHVEAALPQAAAAIEMNYLRPRWNRLFDRQHEYLTALSVAGGRATARQLSVILGKERVQQLSSVRDALIKRGEVYSAASGQVSLAMPLMAGFAVAVYPETRERSDRYDDLASLETMQARQRSWDEERSGSSSSPEAVGAATLQALKQRHRPRPSSPRELEK